MGEVYAANDHMLGEEIGLKVLLRPAAATKAALSRLKAEVQLARRVTDPHVLRVFDIGSYRMPDGDDGDGGEVLFLTMQLLPGETLRERVRRGGPLPPGEVWRLAGDMFAALGAAHQIGIIHRDFKSDNVMLVPMPSGQPRAVVMDFGLAQTVTEAPLSEDAKPLVAGTLGYMAPEQLSGGSVTAAADVYAFGVVLHEMLTGVLPPFRPRVARGGARSPATAATAAAGRAGHPGALERAHPPLPRARSRRPLPEHHRGARRAGRHARQGPARPRRGGGGRGGGGGDGRGDRKAGAGRRGGGHMADGARSLVAANGDQRRCHRLLHSPATAPAPAVAGAAPVEPRRSSACPHPRRRHGRGDMPCSVRWIAR